MMVLDHTPVGLKPTSTTSVRIIKRSKNERKLEATDTHYTHANIPKPGHSLSSIINLCVPGVPALTINPSTVLMTSHLVSLL
jgi:hypothetical protein